MDVLLSLGILAVFAIGLLAMLYDVDCLSEEQLLDELWADEPGEAAA